MNGVLTSADDVILSPETYVTIRNLSGGSFSVVLPGNVPVDIFGTNVVSDVAAQDNQLVNPYPSPLTLAGSGLTDVVDVSSNVFAPEDLVFLLDYEAQGVNKSPSNSYFYHDGTSGFLGAGWYQNGTLTPADTVQIPAGGGFVVRKAASSISQADWSPAIPYSLN